MVIKYMLIFAKAENGKILKMKFSIQLDNRLSPDLTSTEFHSKSAVQCALQCFAKEECCASSYAPYIHQRVTLTNLSIVVQIVYLLSVIF